MTTEIAVLNKLGVALATDSAVTISSSGRTKIFNSADKLFELSSHHPIAIMINGNMDFIGVPWEILVKDFRAQHGLNARASIEAWTGDFLSFIENYSGYDLTISERQNKNLIDDEILALRSKVGKKWQDFLFGITAKKNTRVGTERIMRWVDQTIIQRQTEIDNIGVALTFEGQSLDAVKNAYSDYIRSSIVKCFHPVVLDNSRVETICSLIISMLVSRAISESGSGLVFAGFGSSSLYPEVFQTEIGGFLVGRLKINNNSSELIAGSDDSGRVVSFAQTDVIERLLGGADPQFVDQTSDFISKAVRETAIIIEETCRSARVSKAETQRRQQAIDAVVDAIVSEYNETTAPGLRKKFTREFDRMVAMMPKQELIELAEALVSITAVERKASSDEGTVGGPIDVALVTKHDGFVWIKRKHYFKPHLNPSYFWRRYGRGLMGGNHEDADHAP